MTLEEYRKEKGLSYYNFGTLFMVIMSTVVNIPSISIWAYGGSVIRNYLSNQKLKKLIESILAILLIATAVSVFFYNP